MQGLARRSHGRNDIRSRSGSNCAQTAASGGKGAQAGGCCFAAGGADQAWYYWQEAGKYWEGVPGAIEFVREWLKGRG